MVAYYSVVLRRQMPVLGGMTVSLVGVTIVGYSKIVIRSFLVRYPFCIELRGIGPFRPRADSRSRLGTTYVIQSPR